MATGPAGPHTVGDRFSNDYYRSDLFQDSENQMPGYGDLSYQQNFAPKPAAPTASPLDGI